MSARTLVPPALLRYEARHCGMAAPALLAAGLAGGAVTAGSPPAAQPALAAAAATGLAGLASLAVIAVLARTRALELHLSLPVPFPVLLARRLAVVAAALVGAALALGAGSPEAAASAAAALCPAALLSGVALRVWARRHSPAAASGAAVAVWLGYALFWAVHVPPAVARPAAAALGVVLIATALGPRAVPERVVEEGR
ncbi:hypothetical protein LG943_04510 [Streptomonospora sp. S1-112]|uniref:Uncharacterized protein n=1 Tax=Streptomonospora mangrovi TaxID=2883123 RepID=A0A9X3SEC5_9ACTN|nr:hypothetical protein [Streptomonospora mangrovi]MDA0563595.1 hypothetical protein [Streptomonospora mangrovi]